MQSGALYAQTEPDNTVPTTTASADDQSFDVHELPLDLATARWFGVKNFDAKLPGRCSRDLYSQDDSFVEIVKFPVVLNRVFQVPPGDGLNEFTLCTRFELSAADLQKPLAIHFPWIGEAWELYVNGTLLRDELILDENGDLSHRKIFRHLTVPLDYNQLRTGTNTITVRFAGYQAPTTLEDNTNLGFIFGSGYEVDRLIELQNKHQEYIRIILSSVFFFFGVYHLVLFLYRHQEIYNLFFGIFVIAMAVEYVTGSALIQPFFTEMAWINRFKYAGQAALAPAFLLFAYYYFFNSTDKERGKRILFLFVRIIGFYFGCFMLAFLAMPFTYTEALLLIFQISVIPTMIFGIVLLVLVIVRRKPDAILLGGSILVFMGSALWGILDDHVFHTGVSIMAYGTLFCIISLVFMLAMRFLRVHNESERLNVELSRQKDSFRRFVPAEFLVLLNKQDIADVDLGDAVLKNMSVMFTDIRSFTTLSEAMNTEENFRFLNSYLRRMEPDIQRHAGFVDKFVGDAMLALFPHAEGRSSADSAIQAAVDLGHQLRDFNRHRVQSHFEPISLAMGINTGEVMLGTVGSPARLDTTVIGNTVNLASRLESLNRFYNSTVLFSDFTLRAMREPNRFLYREIDSVQVKGKKEPVIVYELFECDPEDLRQRKLDTRNQLTQAIVFFKSQAFAQALSILKEVHRTFPDDPVTNIYIQRCEQYLTTPPADDWKGVVEFTHK